MGNCSQTDDPVRPSARRKVARMVAVVKAGAVVRHLLRPMQPSPLRTEPAQGNTPPATQDQQ